MSKTASPKSNHSNNSNKHVPARSPWQSHSLFKDDKASVAVFFDNSNIWIEGCKAFQRREEAQAHKYPSGRLDYRWRLDFVRLMEVVRDGREDAVPPQMHCSFTAEDKDLPELWRRFQEIGEVRPFRRSGWSQKEKMVDIALMSSAHVALHLNHGKIDSLVLITGDGDFKPFIEDVLRTYRVKVEVWSWEQALAKSLRDLAAEKSDDVRIRLLDDVIDEIGFLATEWDANLEIPQARTLLVRNVTAEMEDMIIRGGPYRVRKLPQSDYIAIIYEFGGFELTSLIHALQRVASDASDATSYVLWKGQQTRNSPPSLRRPAASTHTGTANRYDGLLSPVAVARAPQPQAEDNTWTDVENRNNNNKKTGTSRVNELCFFGAYCKQGLKCDRAHLQKDQAFFRTGKAPAEQRKTKRCTMNACVYKSCNFVHPGEKTVCLTCGDAFLTPHEWGKCPAIEKFLAGKIR